MINKVYLQSIHRSIVNSLHFKDLSFEKKSFVFFLLLSILKVHAGILDAGTITGCFVNEMNMPIPYVSIVLKNSNDSSLYKTELSNEKGMFRFELVSDGSYFIQAKMIGFEMITKTNLEVNNSNRAIDLGMIKLVASFNKLETVSIVAEKPFIEQLSDRTVVNIENSIVSVGSTAFGVLEKLPGVSISDEGAISLKGKPNTIIYMDGQPTMLSEGNIAILLRGMPSSNIRKIELITSPSAKYDAAGSGGIINIVTKKNRKEELNGNINAGYGQGRYQKINTGIDLGKKTEKCNLFLTYAFSHRKEFNDFRLVRDFPLINNPNSVIESNSYEITPNNNHAPRLGADIYFSKRTTLSIVGSGLFYSNHSTNNSNSSIVDINHHKLNSFDLLNDLKGLWNSYMSSVSMVHQLDTSRREISFDIDYANYLNKIDQTNAIVSKDANDHFMNKAVFIGNQNWKLNIYSAKVDYSQPLLAKIFMEAGLKSSYVNSNSDNRFFNETPAGPIYDSTRSNHFKYAENINAAYLNFKSEFKKLIVQPGFRIEQTVVDAEQLLTNQKINRAYIKLFPSLSISYKANDKNNWNINLTRRINRPSYQLLNPFRLLTDVGTYTQGNPNLKPEIIYSNELNYSFRNSFFATFGYSLTLDRISPALIHDSDREITLRTFINLDYLHFYNLSLTYSKKICSWWTINTTLTPFYQRYSADNNGYTIYNQKAFSFWGNVNSNFYLNNTLSMECSFLYQHTNPAGLSVLKPIYSLNAGIKKIIFKGRASIAVNLNDVLSTNYRRGTARFGSGDAILISNFQGHWDSRILNVSFSYQFGSGKPRKIRRTSGADDEKKRINVG